MTAPPVKKHTPFFKSSPFTDKLVANQILLDRSLSHKTPIRQGHKWSEAIHELNEIDRIEFQKHFNRKREVALDECHGACVRRDRRFAEVIAKSLMHFDGDRYHMGDFVIMPNHFHLLVAFSTPEAMNAQIDSWLHFTATQIHRITGVRGHFWQQEPFDHQVRSEKQYQYLRD